MLPAGNIRRAAVALACLAVDGCGQASSAYPGAAIHCPTEAGGHQVVICAYYDPSARRPAPSPGWRQVPAPALRSNARYYAITATGPADAWAVGNTGLPNEYPLIVHWDGVRWSPVTLSASMRRLETFTHVVAANPANVWVAGNVPE